MFLPAKYSPYKSISQIAIKNLDKNIAICDIGYNNNVNVLEKINVRVISIKKIKDAMCTYPQWRVGLQLWYDTFNKQSLNFESYQQFKELWLNQSCWNVDRIPARKVKDSSFQGENYDTYIFDIHGTDCRVVSRIDTLRNKIFIRGIFSHAEYDKWCKANIN